TDVTIDFIEDCAIFEIFEMVLTKDSGIQEMDRGKYEEKVILEFEVGIFLCLLAIGNNGVLSVEELVLLDSAFVIYSISSSVDSDDILSSFDQRLAQNFEGKMKNESDCLIIPLVEMVSEMRSVMRRVNAKSPVFILNDSNTMLLYVILKIKQGSGGSMLLWNPELKIGFGYCMNAFHTALSGDKRSLRMLREVVDTVKNLKK
ncbi:13832_t:CDS:2, partial [Dentiscutata heterogama]